MSALRPIRTFFARLVEWIAPLGYQDEEGFHYGQPPEDYNAGGPYA